MKKNRTYGLVDSIGLLKMLKMMRFTLYFLLLTLSQALAVNTYSQQTKLSLDMKNARVEDVIDQIEKSSEFFFMYNKGMVNVERKVDIVVEGQLVNQILDKLFENTDVTYSIKDRQIMLINSHLQSESMETTSQQQKKTIAGKVTDTSGATVPGVSVIVKGTTIGVITDNNGSFSLSNVPENAIIQFSFVGMTTQEIKIGTQTTINLVLTEETFGIEEVVAIGYGTSRKKDLTGSVQRVNMSEKGMAANLSLGQALQGQTAGVNVEGGARAGGEPSISIRGRTSLSASDSPLIVLDGIIYNGSISDINVNDVESVDILKDASAAAVYGSRSANGVMIITTKRGKSEKPLFEFNMYYGFQDISNNPVKVFTGNEMATALANFAYQQDKLYPWYKTMPTSITGRPVAPNFSDPNVVSTYLRTEEEKANYLAGNEINWMDEILHIAPVQNYNLSVSGSTKKTNYMISGSYTNQEGVLLNDQFKRATIFSKFENKITDWLTLGLSSQYSHRDYSGLECSLGDAMVASPLANKTNSAGVYPTVLRNEQYQRHPLSNFYINNQDIRDNIFVVFNGKIDIPKIKGLTYNFDYSNTFYTQKQNTFYPITVSQGASNNGLGIKDHSETRNWIINNILTYTKTLSTDHKINATLLYSRENRQGQSSHLEANTFENPILGFNAIQLGTNQKVSSGAWEENSLSYMARLNYTFKNRYLLTGTVRKDGFSGFGANNKFVTLPSVSLAWIASEEAFMKNIKWLDFLKIRTSYGANGNQGIGRYSSYSKMGTTYYVYGSSPTTAVYSSSLGNADLGWEKTLAYNIGLDYAIFKKRISGSFEIYKSTTSDVLVQRAVPNMTGYNSVWDNIGEIKNKGLELELSTVNIEKPFRWESKFVFALNRDEISKLYGGKADKDIGNSWFVGEPISAIYDYKQAGGVWTENDLFSKTILKDYYPGQLKYVDLNKDAVLDATNDRSVIGYTTPNYRFGINNIFSYENFTFSFFLNAIQGGNNYYLGNNAGVVNSGGIADVVYRMNRPAVLQYWTPENGVNNAPGIFYSPLRSAGVYEDRSFVRLQDISLTYSLGSNLVKKLKIQGLQIYLSGKNIYTWTKWSGWDPELGGIPMIKSVIAGFRLSF